MKISSYNCAGFKGNCDYINKTVFKNCDILLLQETWLYNFEFNLFNEKVKNCQYHAVSAMDESDIGRVGRPKGGCAIVWHKNLALSILPIDTKTPRLCAVVVKSKKINLVICNVYMPQDTNTNDNFEIFGDTLYEILTIHEVYSGYDFIIGGDFNVDFNRNNSRNLNLLKQFINEEQLTCVTLRYPINEFTLPLNK